MTLWLQTDLDESDAPGVHITDSFFIKIQIFAKFVWLWFDFRPSDCYKFMSMPQQLSCRDICKIL